VSEQNSLAGGTRPDLDTPGHLASVALLRFLGDVHPLWPGFFAKSRHPTLSTRGAFFGSVALRCRQLADDGDFLAVDDDRGIAVEPTFGQTPGEPFGSAAGIGLLGLLPAPGTPVTTPMMMMKFHDYMITSLQRNSSGFASGERRGSWRPHAATLSAAARQRHGAGMPESKKRCDRARAVVFLEAKQARKRPTLKCRKKGENRTRQTRVRRSQ
jgi:hypothetical protein